MQFISVSNDKLLPTKNDSERNHQLIMSRNSVIFNISITITTIKQNCYVNFNLFFRVVSLSTTHDEPFVAFCLAKTGVFNYFEKKKKLNAYE